MPGSPVRLDAADSPGTGFSAHYLWIDVVVVGSDSAVLLAVNNSATSTIAAEELITIRVGRTAAGYELTVETSVADPESGRAASVGLDAPAVREFAGTELEIVEAAYGAIHDRVLHWARHHGWTRLHAALIDVDGALVAVAGPSGAGKTTLATDLALAGHDLHGDEAIFVRGGDVIALPRPIHLKTGGLGIPPGLEAVPGAVLDYVDPLVVIDPATIAELVRSTETARSAETAQSSDTVRSSDTVLPVRRPRRLDHLIILGERRRGPWAATPASTAEMLATMIDDVAPFADDHAAALRELVLASSAARISVLSAGDGDRAGGAAAVEALVGSAENRP